jgi:hypothetical protein
MGFLPLGTRRCIGVDRRHEWGERHQIGQRSAGTTFSFILEVSTEGDEYDQHDAIVEEQKRAEIWRGVEHPESHSE